MTTTAAPAADGLELVVRPSEDDVAIGGQLALQQSLEQVLAGRPARVVVDLSQCRYLDAPGLRVLLDARLAASAQGTHLRLEHCSDQVRSLLVAAGEAEQLGVAPAA